MTDILTRLAALTIIDENGLLPCPSCGGTMYLRKVGNEHTKQRGWDTGCNNCRFHKCDRVIHQTHEWLLPKIIAAWNNRSREAALIALVQEAAGEIERIRGAAQNLIDTFKIGDDIVKDGIPKYVANAIATTALHQLNQALNPQKPSDG